MPLTISSINMKVLKKNIIFIKKEWEHFYPNVVSCDSSGSVFIGSVSFFSVSVKNTFMRIRKNDSNSIFYNMLYSIKRLLILITYQKGHTILITKRK